MEIVIIVLLLASLFGVWLLSVRRKLETQEENIRNAMYQTLVQLSAEREALEGLAEFLGQTMDAETFRRMKHSLESAQTAGDVRAAAALVRPRAHPPDAGRRGAGQRRQDAP